MMTWLQRLLRVVPAIVLCLPTLSARIGDSRSELEARLRDSGRGIRISDGELADYHIRQSPIAPYVEFSPEMEIQVYYKLNSHLIPTSAQLWQTDNKGRRTDNPVAKPEGWLLHVVYLNGVSVLEYYRRSKRITEIERNGILALSQGESVWKQGRVPGDNEEAIRPRTFSQNHYREDLAVYANVAGDTILLFDPRLDQMIQDEKLREAKALGPDSLDGF